MASEAGKKLVQSKSGLKIVSSSGDAESPLTLREPQWTSDKQCHQCKRCKTKFDFIKRRHHCRRCGHCFCAGCCNDKVPLPRMCFVDPVRHCQTCLQISLNEHEFFEEQVGLLLRGASFTVVNQQVPDVNGTYTCKLSIDQRFLSFEAPSQKVDIDPVELMLIESFQVVNPENESHGNYTGFTLRYKDSCGEEHQLNLSTLNPMLQKYNLSWITAFHKAMKFLQERKQST